MWLFDAHLDLSMNALEWNRDLTQSVGAIRQREAGKTDKVDRGNGTVSLPEMRRGGIGLCVATMIARYVKPSNSLPGWHSPAIAWAQTQGQLAWYRAMEDAGEMVQVSDIASLERHVGRLEDIADDGKRDKIDASPLPGDFPIGYVLSLEGADSMVTPALVERGYAQGLRAIGPAHYGPGTYAQGTHATGGLGPRGRELLAEMQRLNIILDATHLCDDSFWEAVDCYSGPIWASHNNCRALVPDTRQFSDEQIRLLIERGAVIGAVLDAWMLVPNWQRGVTTPQSAGLRLEQLLDHVDHICQLAGNARHVGIGSDLDGAFGIEQTPADLNTIADLARLPAMLAKRGYTADDIQGFAHGNWVNFLRRAWGGATTQQ